MPNHVAQWEAILEAKRRGCEVYDFWGVAPEGAENHSWAGITRFKKGFGGETIHFLGAFDFAFDSSWYRILHAGNIIKKLISKK